MKLKLFALLCLVFTSSVIPAFGDSDEYFLKNPPRLERFDNFNFKAMRKSELGKLILEGIEQNLRTSPSTAKLTEKIIRHNGDDFLDSIREYSAAKIVSHNGKYETGFAAIETSSKLSLPEISQSEKGKELEDMPSKLPQDLIPLIPACFFSDTLSFFVRSSERELVFRACDEREFETPSRRYAAVLERVSELKIGNSTLVCRIFPRREIRGDEAGKRTLLPAGEFELSETPERTSLRMTFHCATLEEQTQTAEFFIRFKGLIKAAAEESRDDATQTALQKVLSTMKISLDRSGLKIEINARNKEFLEFFKVLNKQQEIRKFFFF